MNTFWVHKNWKWKKENATAKYIDAQCEEAVTLADAQATIAALEQRVKELKQWVQDQSTANLETMRHMDEMQSRAMDAESQLTQRTAELERVRLLSSHNERRFEMLEEKYKELRTLVLALPKVEGEIVAQAGYVKDRKKVYACFGSDADMTAYAAIVQHRQGMEG